MPNCKGTLAAILKFSEITSVMRCCALRRMMPSGMTGKRRTGTWCNF